MKISKTSETVLPKWKVKKIRVRKLQVDSKPCFDSPPNHTRGLPKDWRGRVLRLLS